MPNLRIRYETYPMAIEIPSMPLMTIEQFLEFCQSNPDLRIERSAIGEVIIIPPAYSDTGNRNFKIAQQLANWAEQDGTGEGFDSSAGFTLPNGAIRSPDASWIKLSRWNALSAEQQASFAPICPDFVIELKSASDRLDDLRAKMQEYLENGTCLGWLIDCQNRQVYIYRPGVAEHVLDHPESVNGEPELPGFQLKMSNIL